MRRFFVPFVPIAMLVAACSSNDDVILRLPEVQPKLVIGGLQQNGQPWKIWISQSRPVNSENIFDWITNATVLISENAAPTEYLTLQKTETESFYLGGVSPKIGMRYTVTVSAPGFKVASASYTQPDSVSIDSFELTSVVRQGPDLFKVKGTLTFSDPKTTTDYYEVVLGATEQKKYNSNDLLENTWISVPNPRFIFGDLLLASDTDFNGEKIMLEFEASISRFDFEAQKTKDIKHAHILLRHVTEDYYRYYKTLVQSGKNIIDPYAVHTNVYNNVENGFGLFAGYTETHRTIYNAF